MRTEPRPEQVRHEPGTRRGGDRVLRAGLLALAMAIGIYAVNMALHPLHVLLSDVDLAVYRDAGLAARRSPGQLYRWREPSGLQFTYPPFAAAFCMVMSVLPWGPMTWLMVAGSVAALLAAVWLTFGVLGWHGASRIGAAAAVSAVAFWTEPVQRTLHTGEVDLLLMLLVVGDLAGRGRRWRGVGIGLAAGVKLVALIFIRVWIAPALAVLTDTAARARPARRAAWWASAGLAALVFGAWPSMWPRGGAAVPWGLIWYARTAPGASCHPL